MPSQDIVIRTLRFPPEMGAELAAIPGVDAVQIGARCTDVFRKTPVMIVATDVDSLAETATRSAVEGDVATMYRRDSGGSRPCGVGQFRATAAAEARGGARDSGAARHHPTDRSSASSWTTLISRARFSWIDRSFNSATGTTIRSMSFRVYLSRAAQVPEVKRQILARYAGQRQVFVLTNVELKRVYPEGDRSVVCADLGSDRGRRPGGDSWHRQHPDCFDYRSTPRAGRAPGRGRAPWPDSANDLDRGAQHWRARTGARVCARRRRTCTTSCRSCTATSPACGWLTYSRIGGARAGADDPGAALIAAIWPAETLYAARSSRRWSMNRVVRRLLLARAPASPRSRRRTPRADRAGRATAPAIGRRSATRDCCRCSTPKGKAIRQALDPRAASDHTATARCVLRFTAPAEVKGVALLVVNHPGPRRRTNGCGRRPSRRDRRIALQDRSTRFFGTDFSFEDLEERDVDQYDYACLGKRRSTAPLLEDSVGAEADQVVAVHAVGGVDPEGQLRVARVESYIKDKVGSTIQLRRLRRRARGSGPPAVWRWNRISAAAAARA